MLSIILWIFLAFILLYFGGSLAVNGITTIANSLRISKFYISFFILGFFTSITEISVGVTALIEKQPVIFVGNLLGSSIVIFLLIIPALAVAGNGIRINHSLTLRDVILTSFMITLPGILILDGSLSMLDALICIVSYIYVILLVSKRGNIFETLLHKSITRKTLLKSLLKVFLAVVIVLWGSYILLENIKPLSELLNLSPFIISILLVPIGTNAPELTIAINSIINKHKEIAFGNYLGSSALNTLEMGILTILNRSEVLTNGSNFSILVFILGLLLFSFFIKSKEDISRKEGFVLMTFYIIFTLFEIFTGPGWMLK